MNRWIAFLLGWLMAIQVSTAQNIQVIGEERTEARARHLQSVSDRYAGQIFARYGLKTWPDMQVFVLSNAERMKRKAESDHGRTPPEWAAGLAYPRSRMIYLHTAVSEAELLRTYLHELAHIALATADPRGVTPRWFNEGMAVWFSEGPAPERIRILTEAASMDGLHALKDLEKHFPQNGARAGVAYAQSVHFVGFLINRYGEDKLVECLRLTRTTNLDFDGVLKKVYGSNLTELEEEWRAEIEPGWTWVAGLFNETTLWIFAALLLVLGWIRRRRQRGRRLAELKAEEAELDRVIQAAVNSGYRDQLAQTNSEGRTLH